MPQELVVIIALALLYALLNGVTGSSNIVATMISSRAFRPGAALAVAAVAVFFGPFVFGLAVATTIGDEFVRAGAMSLRVLIAGLGGAITWTVLTWLLGMPTSASHALIGGILGAVLVGAGFGAINPNGLSKVLLALFASPVIGFLSGFVLTRLIFFAAQNASPAINELFRRGQLLTSVAMALSHGANDGQKTIGVITLSLLVGGRLNSFEIPLWVIAISAAAIALGTGLGSWRLIRTLGAGFFRVRPVHGCSAQLTSTLVILTASLFGGPVSTTQVVSSSIVGVGSSEGLGRVRWGVVGDIVTAWLITIPASALFAAALYWILEAAQR